MYFVWSEAMELDETENNWSGRVKKDSSSETNRVKKYYRFTEPLSSCFYMRDIGLDVYQNRLGSVNRCNQRVFNDDIFSKEKKRIGVSNKIDKLSRNLRRVSSFNPFLHRKLSLSYLRLQIFYIDDEISHWDRTRWIKLSMLNIHDVRVVSWIDDSVHWIQPNDSFSTVRFRSIVSPV